MYGKYPVIKYAAQQFIKMVNEDSSILEVKGMIEAQISSHPPFPKDALAIVRFLAENHSEDLTNALCSSTVLFSMLLDSNEAVDTYREIFTIITGLPDTDEIFSVRDRRLSTLLHFAFDSCRLDHVEFLFDQPFDFNARDITNSTVLHKLCCSALPADTKIKLITQLRDKMQNFETELNRPGLEVESDPNIPMSKGNTALHLACLAGDVDTVNLLLEFNANPNVTNDAGVCPIDLIPDCVHSEKIKSLLINTGAVPSYDCVDVFPNDDLLEEASEGFRYTLEQAKSRAAQHSENENSNDPVETTTITEKNKLGWDFIQRAAKPAQLAKYLSDKNRTIINIAGTDFEFIDLRESDDYTFIVNTVLSLPKRINELRKGDPQFFSSTPYISACLLNKETRAFAGSHHPNVLFPIYLALEVPTKAIQFTGPTDINSPYACEAGRKLGYLRMIKSVRKKWDKITAQAQTTTRAKTEKPIPFTLAMRDSTGHHEEYFPPSGLRCGTLPFFTPEYLNRATNKKTRDSNSYSELIITTHYQDEDYDFGKKYGRIEGRLLLVEEHFIQEFNKKYPNLSNSEARTAHASMRLLRDIEQATNGRLKLAIIRTDLKAYKRKLPYDQQIELVIKKKQRQINRVKILQRAKHRFEQRGENYPHMDLFEKHMRKLNAILEEQRALEKMLAPEVSRFAIQRP